MLGFDGGFFAFFVDPVGGGGGGCGDDGVEFCALKEAGGSAIAGEGEAEFLVGDEFFEGRTAGFFLVVVGAEIVGEPAEAGHCTEFPVEGIGAAPLEPGVGPGGSSGDGDAVLPGLVEDFIETPFSPQDEHVVG